MKFIPGPLASAMSGSQGGTVASRNKGGAYFRGRVVGVNPKTPKQSQQRYNFGQSAKAWSGTLTADQRQAWTFFAQANPVINVQGVSIQISGLAMYNRLNQVLKNVGVAPISDPPPDMSVPELAAVTGLTMDSVTPLAEITTDAQAVVAGANYYIFGTGPLAAGRTPQLSQYRFLGHAPAVAAAVVTSFLGNFNLTFGTVLAGKNYGVRVATVNMTTGALTPFLTFTTIGT